MEKLIEILNDINPNVDYETESRLIDGGCLDSFAILSLVSELEDAFDIQITPAELIPVNFNSAQAMWSMIQKLQEEK
jgi:Phosphopantetheine attachment site.